MSKEKKSFTLDELATLTNSNLIGDANIRITGVDSLESAGAEDATFLANLKYKELITSTQAGVICIGKDFSPPEGNNYLISDDPSRTFQHIVELVIVTPFDTSGFSSIHETAVIHEKANIGKKCHHWSLRRY